jgi:hypothetical protein
MKDHQLVGLWSEGEGIIQVTDDAAVVNGQMFRYTADGQTLTLIGELGSVQIPYRLNGDVLTYVVDGQTFRARRIPQEVVANLVQAISRGAGVWVGSESSVDPSLVITWTQYMVWTLYVVLYPDGSVDYASSDTGAQVGGYSQQFFYSREASPTQQRMGRWQSDGTNLKVQWNNGTAWQGQADVANGQLMFFGIGRLDEGSNVLFERQPFPFLVEAYTPTARAPSPPTGAQQTTGSEDPVSKLMTLLQEVQTSGRVDPAIQDIVGALASDPRQLMALVNDPQRMEQWTKQFEDAGASDMGSGPPLNIADYYRDGPAMYELRWPIDPSLSLAVPFDRLDRKTQFFVLFSEWTQREMQGMAALNRGQVDGAEQTFQECLERAQQIDVAELQARSYEGLVCVAQQRGDRRAERQWNQAAREARST